MQKLKKATIEKFTEFAGELAEDVKHREENRRDPEYSTPRTSARGLIMMRLYTAGRRKIEANKGETIKALALHFRQSAAGTVEENLFEWLLLAYFGSLGAIDKTLRGKIRSMACELLFAHMNDIDENSLIGFIYERGGASKIRKKLRLERPGLFRSSRITRGTTEKSDIGARSNANRSLAQSTSKRARRH